MTDFITKLRIKETILFIILMYHDLTTLQVLTISVIYLFIFKFKISDDLFKFKISDYFYY